MYVRSYVCQKLTIALCCRKVRAGQAAGWWVSISSNQEFPRPYWLAGFSLYCTLKSKTTADLDTVQTSLMLPGTGTWTARWRWLSRPGEMVPSQSPELIRVGIHKWFGARKKTGSELIFLQIDFKFNFFLFLQMLFTKNVSVWQISYKKRVRSNLFFFLLFLMILRFSWSPQLSLI
jgi:hypothetical protein